MLHWLNAGIILWALLAGFYVALLPVAADVKHWVAWVNVSLTTLMIPLFIWRCLLAFRRRGRAVAQPPALMGRLATAVHLLLYFTITVVLVTGVLMMERPIVVFGWFALPQPLQSPALTGGFHTVHIASCYVLAGLVGVHVLAVLKHALAGQPVLRRMC
nr:cytochrome b/b6 domain-containing protein [Pseudomonas quercus]